MPSVPQLYQAACPRADGSSYAHPCACPQAGFIAKLNFIGGFLCGFPEFGTPSVPPKRYRRLTYSGEHFYNFGGGHTERYEYDGYFEYVGACLSPELALEEHPEGTGLHITETGPDEEFDEPLGYRLVECGTPDTGTSCAVPATGDDVSGSVGLALSGEITDAEVIDDSPEEAWSTGLPAFFGAQFGSLEIPTDAPVFYDGWMDRSPDSTAIDYRNATFAIAAWNLTPGVDYRVTLRIRRAPWSAEGVGEPEEVFADDRLAYEFTAEKSWALLGVEAEPESDPGPIPAEWAEEVIQALVPTEKFIGTEENALAQGWAYDAAILAIEPLPIPEEDE